MEMRQGVANLLGISSQRKEQEQRESVVRDGEADSENNVKDAD